MNDHSILNKKVVEEIYNDGINRNNFSVLDRLVDTCYVNHELAALARGPEALKCYIGKFIEAFPDLHIQLQNVVAEGDLVTTRGYWTGTHLKPFMSIAPTSKVVRVDFLECWKVYYGKAVEHWIQMDIAGLYTQLGASVILQEHAGIIEN